MNAKQYSDFIEFLESHAEGRRENELEDDALALETAAEQLRAGKITIDTALACYDDRDSVLCLLEQDDADLYSAVVDYINN